MSDWYTDPFDRFLTFIQEADRVLNLSIKGIYQISHQMPLLKALDNLERVRAENAMKSFQPKNLESAKAEAEFARQEIEKEFPLLHAHALVSIWSAMEALFEDVLVAHIIHRPEMLKEEVFQKIRIPLATYEQLNQEDKARLLVYELQRTLSSEQRLGLDCFEALLKVVGLAGKVEDDGGLDAAGGSGQCGTSPPAVARSTGLFAPVEKPGGEGPFRHRGSTSG